MNNIRQYLETLNWFVFERKKALKIEAEKQAEIERLAAIEAASHAAVEEASKALTNRPKC